MTGIQDVVFRIPEEWDAVWFDSMIQDLFRYSDIRNANGVGISISGDSETVATLSSTTLSEAYVVTQASSELTDERVLAGETGVIDITDGGPGNNVTVSVATNGIDFEKLQTVSTAIFAGRITAGTGDIEELTATQATSLLNAFTGDSGSGGLKGLVPAPSSGDAGKYLDGDGTFTTTNTAFNKNFGTTAGTVLEGDTTINLTSHVTGILPLANGGTGSSTLTSGEVAQIENIGSTTISGTQWGYVGAFNQGLTTTSNVNFNNATFTGDLSVSATKKIYFDGGSNTYISEVVADNLWFYFGGSRKLRIGAAGMFVENTAATFNANFTVGSGNEVFLNLPTSPGTAGSLWNDSGTVKVA